MPVRVIAALGFALLLPVGVASAASANLLVNGDFSVAEGAGWDTEIDYATGSGISFEGGVAKLGRTGTPGEATLSQSFSIDTSSGTTQSVSIMFDYDWEFTAPETADTFTAILSYETISSSTQYITLKSQSSLAAGDTGAVTRFDPQFFNQTFTLNDLSGTVDNATISFTIVENNILPTPGTFVQLDNVGVSAVPLPAAAWLFGSALLGLVTVARRRVAA